MLGARVARRPPPAAKAHPASNEQRNSREPSLRPLRARRAVARLCLQLPRSLRPLGVAARDQGGPRAERRDRDTRQPHRHEGPAPADALDEQAPDRDPRHASAQPARPLIEGTECHQHHQDDALKGDVVSRQLAR